MHTCWGHFDEEKKNRDKKKQQPITKLSLEIVRTWSNIAWNANAWLLFCFSIAAASHGAIAKNRSEHFRLENQLAGICWSHESIRLSNSQFSILMRSHKSSTVNNCVTLFQRRKRDRCVYQEFIVNFAGAHICQCFHSVILCPSHLFESHIKPLENWFLRWLCVLLLLKNQFN